MADNGTLPEGAWSPDIWNGVQRFNDLEQTSEYQRTCLSCGREQGRSELLTHARYLLLSRAGLPRCFHCGSYVYFDPVVVGRIGSPRAVTSGAFGALTRTAT